MLLEKLVNKHKETNQSLPLKTWDGICLSLKQMKFIGKM